MHNLLSNLPRRVVLDANILLDGTFVRDGMARRSIDLLGKLGFSVIIDEDIVREAERVIEKYSRKFSIAVDLREYLRRHMRDMGYVFVTASSQLNVGGISRHDRHVSSAAIQSDAWVLTGDLKLYSELISAGLQARSPIDIAMEVATSAGKNPDINDIVRIVSPGKHLGMLFGRVIIGNWAGRRGVGKFTVVDIENIGKIYFDTDDSEWVFRLATQAVARLKVDLVEGEQWVVCGTYLLPGAGKRGNVQIRASRSPLVAGVQHTKTEPSLKQIVSSAPGQISIGHSVEQKDFWNGHIRSIVVGPQGMRTDRWNAILSIPEASPNPFDDNMLSRVFEQLAHSRISQGVLQIPTAADLAMMRL